LPQFIRGVDGEEQDAARAVDEPAINATAGARGVGEDGGVAAESRNMATGIAHEADFVDFGVGPVGAPANEQSIGVTGLERQAAIISRDCRDRAEIRNGIAAGVEGIQRLCAGRREAEDGGKSGAQGGLDL
jgi:hypothetical protein